MNSQRSLFLLLISTILVTSVTVRADGPKRNSKHHNNNELNSDVDEPQIDLPEVAAKKNPFRNVAQGVRKDSRDPLVKICQEAVDTTARRLLSTEQHTPWQVMHALLGLRRDFVILHDGQQISGLDWVSQGQVFDNEYWFERTQFGGRAHPYNRPYAFEGHANQFLAILSMCGIDLDMEFGTADGSITMRGMIEHAKMSMDLEKDEPTWTLWALSRYLPPNARWRDAKGDVWSIERLVQEQTEKPMLGAPCGGTHSLFALAHARNVYLRQGRPLRGVWLQAEYKIRQHINTARMQQNSNGTLSSNFFRGKEYNPDFNKRMASAGHLLEFLMIALPQRELKARWVRRAIEATAKDLLNNRKAYVKCSPLYHSVNALNIYLDRVNPRSAPVPTPDPAPKTALLAPGRLKEPSGELRGVPAIGIAQSRELPRAADEDKQRVAAQTPPKTGNNVATATPMPTDPPKTATPKAPALAESSLKAAIQKDLETWAATPNARRTVIVVPEEKVNVETQKRTDSSDVESDPKPADSVEPTSDPLSGRVIDLEATAVQPQSAPAAADSAITEIVEPADATPKTTDKEEQTAGTETGSSSESTADLPRSVPDSVNDGPSTADGEVAAELGIPIKAISSPRLLEIPSVNEAATAGSSFPNRSAVTDGINDQFLDPELDPQDWIEKFESESRDVVAGRDAVVEAIGLKTGDRVADIGAGTGLFLKSFATAVSDQGRVFAIDISPRLVQHLEERAAEQGLANVCVVRNDTTSLQLVNYRIDKAFLCDTYHHFEYPKRMLASIYSALNPGGELIVVDFERVPGESRELVLTTVRADKQTFRTEIEGAGFEYVEEVTIPEFTEHYFLRFRRPADQPELPK